MNTLNLALQGAWKVLLAGLVFGTGMPVVYALAMRALTVGSTEIVAADGTTTMKPSAMGKVMMALLIGVILIAVAIGILIILAGGLGKVVQFGGDFPFVDLVSKKK